MTRMALLIVALSACRSGASEASAATGSASAAADPGMCAPAAELESCTLDDWCDEHNVAEADCKICNHDREKQNQK